MHRLLLCFAFSNLMQAPTQLALRFRHKSEQIHASILSHVFIQIKIYSCISRAIRLHLREPWSFDRNSKVVNIANALDGILCFGCNSLQFKSRGLAHGTVHTLMVLLIIRSGHNLLHTTDVRTQCGNKIATENDAKAKLIVMEKKTRSVYEFE